MSTSPGLRVHDLAVALAFPVACRRCRRRSRRREPGSGTRPGARAACRAGPATWSSVQPWAVPTDSTSTIETSVPTPLAAATNASAPESSVSPVTSSSPVDGRGRGDDVEAGRGGSDDADAQDPVRRRDEPVEALAQDDDARVVLVQRDDAVDRQAGGDLEEAGVGGEPGLHGRAGVRGLDVGRRGSRRDFTSDCGVPKLFQVAEAPSAETASSCAWVGSTTAVRESKSGSCTASSSRKTIARPPGGAARSARHAAPATN